MLGTSKRDVDQIAEFADASVRQAIVKPRKGSLPGIKGRTGFNEWLYTKFGNRGNAVYTLVGSGLTVLLIAGLAYVFQEPMMFPSLGASALLFFETPMAEVSSARNTVIGHFVAAGVALITLFAFGFDDEPSALQTGFSDTRVVSVALCVAFTGGILRLLRAAHPPAGATTVIVGAGLLTSEDMLVFVCSVLAISLFAGVVNRAFGVPAPLWSHPYSSARIKRTLGLQRRGGAWWNEPA